MQAIKKDKITDDYLIIRVQLETPEQSKQSIT